MTEEQSGYLLFSDIPRTPSTRWTPDGHVSVFVEKSGYTGKDINHAGRVSIAGRLYVWQIGSNGPALDPQGRLVIAAAGDKAIARIEGTASARSSPTASTASRRA